MAKSKAKGKEKPKEASGPVRNWTSEQRRAAFLEARKKEKPDFRILESDFKEVLVPYDNIVFDYVLSLGGIARHGRVLQIHGDEGSGKTTTMLCSIAARYQKAMNEPIAIFDYEGTTTIEYVAKMGIDPSLCFFEQPTNLQQAIDRHIELMAEWGVRLFVNDSIPFMDTKVERRDIHSGKAFKSNFGSHARGMSQFYRFLRAYTLEYDAALMMVNQTRDRIDDEAMGANKYSYTNRIYSLPGGRMARFAPSVMLELTLEQEIRPWEWSKMPDEKEKWLLIQPKGDVAKNFPTASRVRVRSLKNKVTSGGFREGTIYIRNGIGIDQNMSIRELACTYNLIGYAPPNKYFVGVSKDDALATYGSKKDIIEDLVIKQNPEILGKLKGMVTDAIKTDDTERFQTTVTESEIVALEGLESAPDNDEDFGKGETRAVSADFDLSGLDD